MFEIALCLVASVTPVQKPVSPGALQLAEHQRTHIQQLQGLESSEVGAAAQRPALSLCIAPPWCDDPGTTAPPPKPKR